MQLRTWLLEWQSPWGQQTKMASRQSSTTHSPLPSMTEEEMELFSALLLAPSHITGVTATEQPGKIALVRQRNTTEPKKDGEDWWKVQPKYSAKVLIGNWLEERKRVRLGRKCESRTGGVRSHALQAVQHCSVSTSGQQRRGEG